MGCVYVEIERQSCLLDNVAQMLQVYSILRVYSDEYTRSAEYFSYSAYWEYLEYWRPKYSQYLEYERF